MNDSMPSEDAGIEKSSAPTSRSELLIDVGQRLQASRQSAAISLLDASSHLNLSPSYLEALESGDWSIMPGDVYALAFLRQYAKYLHLNIDDVIDQLKLNQYTLTKPLTFPDPPIAPSKTWMVVSLLAFLLLFVVFNIFDHEPAPLPSQLIEQHAAEVLNSKTGQDAAIEKDINNGVTVEANQAAMLNTQQAESSTQHLIPTMPSTTSPPMTEHSYQLKAINADVWLQLHKATEPPALIREVLLKKGQQVTITQHGRVWLTTGNAPALEVIIDGIVTIKAGSLDAKGKVLRNFELVLPQE